MGNFFKFFYEMMTKIAEKIGKFFGDFWAGLWGIFSFNDYNSVLVSYKDGFTVWDWIFTVVFYILLIGLFILIAFGLFLLIKKFVRIRKTFVAQEELVTQIDDLNKKVVKLVREKDNIMALKVAQLGIKPGEDDETAEGDVRERFSKLTDVDLKYSESAHITDSPQDFTLEKLAADIQNFACKELKLYYDIRTIRLFVAGLAASKLMILEGISGTGKTSLPYAVGKFLTFDTPIIPVQPSWRDKSELIGYFNEFTKRFNETDFLKALYEYRYRNTVGLIVLDEMNLARIEYYFAEVLSTLEIPNSDERLLDIVPDRWARDPKLITNGKLQFPTNVWFVGTANNDDSTFTITDKVYDRAIAIPIDTKGSPFEPGLYEKYQIEETYLTQLFRKAKEENIVSQDLNSRLAKLDKVIMSTFRITFGNRILKQINDFIPVYTACGGNPYDGLDFLLVTKIFRKLTSLNLAYEKDNFKKMLDELDKIFGKDKMSYSKEFIGRLIKNN